MEKIKTIKEYSKALTRYEQIKHVSFFNSNYLEKVRLLNEIGDYQEGVGGVVLNNKSLIENDSNSLFDHDSSKLIGRFIKGSDDGLDFKIEYNDNGVQFLKDIGVIKNNIELKVGASYEVANPFEVRSLGGAPIVKIIKQDGDIFTGDNEREYLADGGGVKSWHPRYFLVREIKIN
ncbi:hypothetical protein [Pedobacter sp.]|uniref:hypothetical protein n=1 Tax=Pedobacter sp. TaxID=1411316 RepID=UPI003C6527D5